MSGCDCCSCSEYSPKGGMDKDKYEELLRSKNCGSSIFYANPSYVLNTLCKCGHEKTSHNGRYNGSDGCIIM